jgi:hypothetical protein
MMLDTTTLDRRWLAKMTIFFAVLVFFGGYGLVDALVLYPNRGVRHASFCEFQYLEAARDQGRLDRSAIIEDPVATYRRLAATDRRAMSAMDAAALEWLVSLSRVGAWSLRAAHLAPEFTRLEPKGAEFVRIGGPVGRHAELKQHWTTAQGLGKNAPKALAAYDIPFQWVFVVVGFGGGAWLGALFIAVSRRRYQWDAETQTLHLPLDGAQHTLVPADIDEFDKRKWDKYLVFLKIRPEHPTLGGREIKLDLYRYARLESWILAMEKTAFPQNVAESDAAPAEEQAAAVTAG